MRFFRNNHTLRYRTISGGTSDNIRKYLKRDDDRMIVFAQSPGIAKKCVTSYNNSD